MLTSVAAAQTSYLPDSVQVSIADLNSTTGTVTRSPAVGQPIAEYLGWQATASGSFSALSEVSSKLTYQATIFYSDPNETGNAPKYSGGYVLHVEDLTTADVTSNLPAGSVTAQATMEEAYAYAHVSGLGSAHDAPPDVEMLYLGSDSGTMESYAPNHYRKTIDLGLAELYARAEISNSTFAPKGASANALSQTLAYQLSHTFEITP